MENALALWLAGGVGCIRHKEWRREVRWLYVTVTWNSDRTFSISQMAVSYNNNNAY